MRRLLPDSLGGVLFAIVLGLLILIQGIGVVSMVLWRDASIVASASAQAARDLIQVTRVIERAPPQERRRLIASLSNPLMRIRISQEPAVWESDGSATARIMTFILDDEFPPGTQINIQGVVEREDIAQFFGDMDAMEDDDDEDDWDDRPSTQGPMPRSEMGGDERPFWENDGAVEEELARQARERQIRILRTERRNWLQEMRGESDVEQRLNFIDSLRGFQPFYRASVSLNGGMWFNVRGTLDLETPPQRFTPFYWTAGMSLLVALLAIMGTRKATKPLSSFALAAERLGIDVNAQPMEEGGPREVRRAAYAFNTMQKRLKRFVEDRTQMLAAISHDLRTPITRLRLRAEFMEDDDQRERMLHDLDEMEAMIASTLSFARDDAAREPLSPVDLVQMLQTLTEDKLASGEDVGFEPVSACTINGRPLSLKRAITNLVENAIKYGGRARIQLSEEQDFVVIDVEDDGPGIPEGKMEEVFRPFFRLEGSRSRETGGSGLGMAIARNAVRAMGGDIVLINRAGGGLTARITLPKTA